MEPPKKDIVQIRQVFKIILIWISLDLLFYILGLVISLLISNIQNEDFYFRFRFHSRSLIYQFLTFSIFSLMAIQYVGKKYFLYIYPISLLIIYNLIFISHLRIEEGHIKFVADQSSFSIKYLEINEHAIPCILYSFKPLVGIFDGGCFCPDDTVYFYILWILLPILYYFGLSWITNRIFKLNMLHLLRKRK